LAVAILGVCGAFHVPADPEETDPQLLVTFIFLPDVVGKLVYIAFNEVPLRLPLSKFILAYELVIPLPSTRL